MSEGQKYIRRDFGKKFHQHFIKEIDKDREVETVMIRCMNLRNYR